MVPKLEVPKIKSIAFPHLEKIKHEYRRVPSHFFGKPLVVPTTHFRKPQQKTFWLRERSSSL
jgi:hypothetical protein